MPCDQPKSQLFLYLDGELVPPEALAVEQHLQQCRACQREAAAHQRLRSLLRTTLQDEEVPTHLWPAMQQRIAQEAATHSQSRITRSQRRLWISGGVLAALLLLALTMYQWTRPSVPVVVQEIVASQIRSRLMEASYNPLAPDPVTIRRWFQDKVEFSVLVPSLPEEQYTFLGVRLNYFLNRRVAEMAYTVSDRMLSFLMFPDHGITLPAKRTVRAGARTFYLYKYKGYSAVLWKDGEFFCSLVSDLPPTALLQVAREATGEHPAS